MPAYPYPPKHRRRLNCGWGATRRLRYSPPSLPAWAISQSTAACPLSRLPRKPTWPCESSLHCWIRGNSPPNCSGYRPARKTRRCLLSIKLRPRCCAHGKSSARWNDLAVRSLVDKFSATSKVGTLWKAAWSSTSTGRSPSNYKGGQRDGRDQLPDYHDWRQNARRAIQPRSPGIAGATRNRHPPIIRPADKENPQARRIW